MDFFVEDIVHLKTRFMFSVTSWFRTPKRNKNKGGHPQSLHMIGYAMDIVLDDKNDTTEFMSMCRRLNLRPIEEHDHIHVQIN